jgi:hypothetical protein
LWRGPRRQLPRAAGAADPGSCLLLREAAKGRPHGPARARPSRRRVPRPPPPSRPQLCALRVPSPSGYEAGAAAGASTSGLADACADVAAKVRENVKLRRGFLLAAPPGGVVGAYVHMPAARGLGRIVSAVALEAPGGGVPKVRAGKGPEGELGASLGWAAARRGAPGA